MPKEFNTLGTCIPEKHYMVDISHKLDEVFELVAKGRYFTINRPRQFGKTTHLYLLYRRLVQSDDYLPLRISFEGVGDLAFQTESAFVQMFIELLEDKFELMGLPMPFFDEPRDTLNSFTKLSKWVRRLCQSEKKFLVLMIDEVDKNSNTMMFLSFLGMLRDKLLKQNEQEDRTFHSVILVGVHDVKQLKWNIHQYSDAPKTLVQHNSPWNIAEDFHVDLSFNPSEIATMLTEYAQVEGVSMDIPIIAEKLFYYTSGYPFLVSKLCRMLAEEIMTADKTWTLPMVDLAIRDLLQTDNTNFQTLIKNVRNHKDLANLVREVILEGRTVDYNPKNWLIEVGTVYGFFRNEQGTLQIYNRIYSLLLYDYLISEVSLGLRTENYNYKGYFVESNGGLNFKAILQKFQEFMREQYSEKDQPFLERNGRLVFLAFIKPLINGKGFDFKEIEISEEKRLDVVITYLQWKYLVELKIWRGEVAHQKGIQQLYDYMERQNLEEGHLLIFDFRKATKSWKQETLQIEKKTIFIAWV